MSEINVSHRFSWEPVSWAQSIKALFRTPPPVSTWFADLERFNMASLTTVREEGSPRLLPNGKEQPIENSCTVFHKSIAYLAKYSNARLEGILVNKFEQISSSEGLENVFHSILLLSLRTHRPKMLEVCQKVLSFKKLAELFNVADVKELAQKEASVADKPQHRVASISKSLIHALQQPLQKIRKVTLYIFSTTSQAYGVNFDNPPPNSQRAQGQWTFYRDTLHDICVIVPVVKAFFTVQWKTSIATATLLAVSVTAAYRLSESPARNISRFNTELPLRIQESDDIQQCHTPSPGSQLRREPSAGFESYLLVLERQLDRFNAEREKTIKDCNIARDSNPNWLRSPKGENLFKEKEKIEKNITEHKNKMIEARKLSLRLEKLSQLSVDYSQKRDTLIHFLNEQIPKEQSKKTDKSLEESSQKDYLFLKFLALQEIRRENDMIITKCRILTVPTRLVPRSRRAVSDSNLGFPLQSTVSDPPVHTSLTAQSEPKVELPLGQ